MKWGDVVSEKNRQIEKARRLGREYLYKYWGCAQTTLMAVAAILDIKVNDELFKSMVGLSGFSGGCGGMCAATVAISLKCNSSRSAEDVAELPETLEFIRTVRKVRDRFDEAYGGYLCRDIQKRLFGRSFDPTWPRDREAFAKLNPLETCSKVTENAAGWIVEAILDMEMVRDEPEKSLEEA